MDMKANATPLAPPKNEAELVEWVQLWRSRRVGPSTFVRLVSEHGDVCSALAALPEIAKHAGVDNYQPSIAETAQAEIHRGRMAGAALIPMGDARYPRQLYDLPDAPPLFWALGDLQILARPMVAIVGARNCSSLGGRMARTLARDLSEQGYVVASGLARGADTAAHHGAGPSHTLAVFAGGIDVVYPTENAVLAQEIERQGLRIAEQPPGTPPLARHFLSRNRIISGLARAVVVVEAAANSGSLTTARTALDQGRDVLAVPGNPMDARTAGCNMLIRDGAILVRSADDVIEAIGPAMTQPQPLAEPVSGETPNSSAREHDGSALHSEIINTLSLGPKTADELIRSLKLPASRVTPMLVTMETTGAIIRKTGGLMQLS